MNYIRSIFLLFILFLKTNSHGQTADSCIVNIDSATFYVEISSECFSLQDAIYRGRALLKADNNTVFYERSIYLLKSDFYPKEILNKIKLCGLDNLSIIDIIYNEDSLYLKLKQMGGINVIHSIGNTNLIYKKMRIKIKYVDLGMNLIPIPCIDTESGMITFEKTELKTYIILDIIE